MIGVIALLLLIILVVIIMVAGSDRLILAPVIAAVNTPQRHQNFAANVDQSHSNRLQVRESHQ
ncbi:MAG: hypothetical protein ACLR17_07545 [Enterobacteriaceae bacterium]